MNNLKRRILNKSGVDIDPTTGRGFVDGYEVVDLGLPSGLLWATCNVGAAQETGYGNYYKYGKGSQTYGSSSSSYSGWEMPLSLSADTARQVMGSGWRMPRSDEFSDLINNTYKSFVNNFNGSGINGCKFTSKTNPNAYLFIPAAGYCASNTYPISTNCAYWSSTPDGQYSANYLNLSGSSHTINGMRRDWGLSVRGVYQEPGKPMPPMRVLFVNKTDTTQKQIFEQDNWPSASDWTPIGIVVVPGSHNRYGDGKNGIMSLGCIGEDGTMQTTGTTDNLKVRWGSHATSAHGATTLDGSSSNYGYVQQQTNSSSAALSYSQSSWQVAYPYTNLNATENRVMRLGALWDCAGVWNTDKNIASTQSYSYPAAEACRKFSTVGTSVGDWYLPAVGELAYLPSIRYQVNDTISALNAKYGNVGVMLDLDSEDDTQYWSSTQGGGYYYAWCVYMKDGIVVNDNKNIDYHVRAFMRF